MRRIQATALALVAAVVTVTLLASGESSYEVWAIDQSNSPGTTFGGTLYVWDGRDLERGPLAASAPVEKIDLGGATAALCLARTGANPVRPHMMAMNPAQTHAVISFVASGHVVFMDAATRQPVACFRTSAGAGGARQAHMSTPSPDGTYVTVANQNGKLFERILTNYATNTFVHDTAATLNLAACTTPNGLPCETAALRPDNAPICPITESTSRFTFVTLRGGGLFVVDSRSTPMRIVGEYDTGTVHGNGCLGAEYPARCTSILVAARLPTCTRPTCMPSRLTDTPASMLRIRRRRNWSSAMRRRALTHTGRRSRSTASICGLPIAGATSSGSWTPRPMPS